MEIRSHGFRYDSIYIYIEQGVSRVTGKAHTWLATFIHLRGSMSFTPVRLGQVAISSDGSSGIRSKTRRSIEQGANYPSLSFLPSFLLSSISQERVGAGQARSADSFNRTDYRSTDGKDSEMRQGHRQYTVSHRTEIKAVLRLWWSIKEGLHHKVFLPLLMYNRYRRVSQIGMGIW